MTKHNHSGKSSESILDVDKIVSELNLSSSDVFLDVGCGDGFFSVKVAPLVKQVYALDPHEYSVNQLKEKNVKNIETIQKSIVSTSLEDNSIDIIYISNVLHGLVINDQFNDSLKEINRILKQGGKLVIVEFKKMEADRGPSIEHKLSEEQIEELMVGFKKQKVVDVGELSYLIVLTKD